MKFKCSCCTIQTMKKLIAVLLTVLVTLPCLSQVAVDIFDPFYEDLSDWENSGLINYTPNMRPLPLQEIERVLKIVMEAGNERERELATEHYNRIFQRVAHFGATADIGLGLKQNEPASRALNLAPLLDLNYAVSKYLSISAHAKVHVINKLPSDEPQPKYNFSDRDIKEDNVGVGRFKILPAFNMGCTVGNSNYYFSANMARTSFAPFYDSGIFVNREIMHQGQFSLVVNKPIVSFTQTLLAISASDDNGKNIGPNKFLAIHGLDVRPVDWFSFGILDSVVFGGRFDPTYLLPFSVFFTSQGLFGFPDNSAIGARMSIKPIDGLRIDGAVYADDMGFNDMAKFKKDVKARISGQFGISYTMPEKHWFKSAALDYTFVTPYCYTHIAGDTGTTTESHEPNYENYTHYGKNLGTTLDPNSDRINIKLRFEPISGLRISLSDTFIRHANVNESVTDPRFLLKYMTEPYNTTGTVFNHASIKSPDINGEAQREDLFQHANPFMRQKTIEYINQLSIDISCRLPIIRSGGYMKFFFSYCFEADINPGVTKPMFYSSDTSKAWKGAVLDAVEAGTFTLKDEHGTPQTYYTEAVINEANRQKEEWRKNALGKRFRHYIKLGATFSY